MIVTAPAMSKCRSPSLLDSGSRRGASIAAAMPIGTLTNRTHSQPAHSVSMPPSRTPTAPPEPATAPHTPIALLRSEPSAKRTVTMRQRGRGEQRGTETLDGTSRDEPSGALREAAGQRGRGEEDQAGDEQAPTSEKIGQPTAEEQEAAEHEHVRVDDPREVVLREVEVRADRRERDVDDRGVEDDDELRCREQRQGQPLVGAGLGHVRKLLGRMWNQSSGSALHDTEALFRFQVGLSTPLSGIEIPLQ